MENYNSEKEQMAINYLSGSYIKIPRKIFVQMCSKSSFERRTGWFHLLLIGLCYHTDGYVVLDSCKVSCRRGEYVGTYRYLSEISEFNIATVWRLMSRLSSQGLIDVTHLKGGTRIRICGYQAIAESQSVSPNKPSPFPRKPLSELSEASKNQIMRKEIASDDPEIQFF